MNPQTTTAQDLNDRLDQVEEFYLPDIIEHQGEPLARVTSVAPQDLHLGAAQVRPYRKIELISSRSRVISAGILDSAIIVLFLVSCVLLYKSIVWTIWG